MAIQINRRKLLKLAAFAPLPLMGLTQINSKTKAKIVIVGGGFGGATCARYLKKMAPELLVTLIEKEEQIVTCPFSNTVISGHNDISYISHSFEGLKKDGITVLRGLVISVEPKTKTIKLHDGSIVPFDRLVLSPGIDFKWGHIEGYNEQTSEKIPHAWRGGSQTILLRKQIEAMDDGGTVLISVPRNPFRCPPGPYERASLVASYLMKYKPKSKIILFDDKDKFSKQKLFTDAWKNIYGEMIEWVPFSEKGSTTHIDVSGMTLHSEFASQRADVINVIPPQKASNLVHTIGLTENADWCEVNQSTFESKIISNIYILGDSTIAGEMPKSGFSAASQAKCCAHAIIAEIFDLPQPEPSFINTCYSLISTNYGISVVAVYRVDQSGIIKSIKGAGGLSPRDEDLEFRKLEADYARAWYKNFTQELYG